jgi:hypothetical protein
MSAAKSSSKSVPSTVVEPVNNNIPPDEATSGTNPYEFGPEELLHPPTTQAAKLRGN